MTLIPPELTRLASSKIREFPDFPETGVLFRDFTPLMADGDSFGALIDGLAKVYEGKVDAIAGLESRGFILAAPLAKQLGVGVLPIRKSGKLPGPVLSISYELEYGQARMEIRPDSVPKGARVLIVDDVLATGGTAEAGAQLIESAGGIVVGICVLIELLDLKGQEKVSHRNLASVIQL
ncbi:MAG: adenine phosphoribosyltransferase [Actinomycetaceae bacterium]|nr:adenine phosphoribosyltransferase [Actinomycetaceae bacterium]